MHIYATRILFAFFVLGVMLMGRPALAQQSGVQIGIERENLGLGGIVQRGVWTPVRVELTNTGAEDIEVHCRWLLSDEDGDELIAQRSQITLQSGRTQGVWLYATPPMSTRPGETWVFQAVDANSGELLDQAQEPLSDSAFAEPSVNLIGMCGLKGMGLEYWLRWSTHHEQLRLVRGLSLADLPDRWYGLDSLSSLVWMPSESANNPNHTGVSVSSKRALREWVFRGGHLVIVLPYAGEPWTGGDSGLADLLEPIKAGDIVQAKARPPISVFGVLRSTQPVEVNWFDLSEADGYTTLAEINLTQVPADLPEGVSPPPDDFKPLIVGKRFGFGQVTLVGIDLSNPDVLTSIDAFRLHRVWTRILSWRASITGELIPDAILDDPQNSGVYYEAEDATQVELGNWMGQRVAHEGKTSAAIGLAFVLFVVYVVFAAVTFPNFLKPKGWQRHSWMLFVCIVSLFSIVAWGGAWVMRPAVTSSSHFTVLDIDGNTNMVRAQSWQSLLIPTFGTAEVKVGSESAGFPQMDVVNLLSSPGNDLSPDSPGYPDKRTYAFDAAQPSELPVPMRSTTKSLRVDFLGQITGQQDGLARPWDLPQSALRIVKSGDLQIPAGTITHDFPEALTDVHIIYCPGGAQQTGKPGSAHKARPLVYRYANSKGNPIDWQPGTPMALPNSDKAYRPLWIQPKDLNTPVRYWDQEGYLGQAMKGRGYSGGSGNASNVAEDIPLLTFYGALPPPLYKVQQNTFGYGMSSPHNTYSRSLVRDLDMTHLITGRRIILIGHLRNSTSPVPLTIDGEDIPSTGWTVVRWIYDL